MLFESAEDIAGKVNEYLQEKRIDSEVVAIIDKTNDQDRSWIVKVINKR